MIKVQLESPNQADVILLIEELDAYQDSLYPAEARYALNLKSLDQEHVLFAVARDSDGAAIGCGAIVLGREFGQIGGAGELKRMFVRQDYRSQGTAAKILEKLEKESEKRGCKLIQLETGPLQPQAIAFYKKQGFEICAAFGDYPEHHLSIFMQKHLGHISSMA